MDHSATPPSSAVGRRRPRRTALELDPDRDLLELASTPAACGGLLVVRAASVVERHRHGGGLLAGDQHLADPDDPAQLDAAQLASRPACARASAIASLVGLLLELVEVVEDEPDQPAALVAYR